MRPCLHCPTVAQPSAYLQVQEKQLELETVTQALAAGRSSQKTGSTCSMMPRRVPAQFQTCKFLCLCALKPHEALQSTVEGLQKQAILFWHSLLCTLCHLAIGFSDSLYYQEPEKMPLESIHCSFSKP